MFETHKTRLKNLLEDISDGDLQLPEFQRSYVWADDDVRGLLASIAKGFPVGALLTLEAGSEVNFRQGLSKVPQTNKSHRILFYSMVNNE